MCFSPEASFAGGIVISSIGVAVVRKAKKVQKPSQIVFAGIPLFFGVQQIAEGFVWLALSDPEYARLQNIGTYLFLFMARVLWPMLMPLSVLLMEEDHKRKNIMWVFFAMGSSVSLYYSYCLLFLNVTPNIASHHIQYISDFPESLAVPVFIIYFIASLTPLFISSTKRAYLLGVLLFLSAVVTEIYFFQYLTSVWCFFAAVISGVIFWILGEPIQNSSSETVQVEMGLK
ncbi:MAG: hypothetical protein Q8L88_15780 [Bacteroidota bacterium]|nr:hypothetical protein [Bacteroidota bacterium]